MNDLQQISQLTSEVTENPMLLMDSGWKARVVVPYEDLVTQLQKIKNYKNVPPRFQESHELLIKCADEYIQSRDSFYTGVDNLDADMINQASNHMKRGGDYLNQATSKLNEIKAELENAN